MYNIYWLILCVFFIFGGAFYVAYVTRQKKKGKTGFDVRHGEETGYHGPPADSNSFF